MFFRKSKVINDRQNEFIDKNMSLSENNCTFNGYDNKTKKAKCVCPFNLSYQYKYFYWSGDKSLNLRNYLLKIFYLLIFGKLQNS